MFSNCAKRKTADLDKLLYVEDDEASFGILRILRKIGKSNSLVWADLTNRKDIYLYSHVTNRISDDAFDNLSLSRSCSCLIYSDSFHRDYLMIHRSWNMGVSSWACPSQQGRRQIHIDLEIPCVVSCNWWRRTVNGVLQSIAKPSICSYPILGWHRNLWNERSATLCYFLLRALMSHLLIITQYMTS